MFLACLVSRVPHSLSTLGMFLLLLYFLLLFTSSSNSHDLSIAALRSHFRPWAGLIMAVALIILVCRRFLSTSVHLLCCASCIRYPSGGHSYVGNAIAISAKAGEVIIMNDIVLAPRSLSLLLHNLLHV